MKILRFRLLVAFCFVSAVAGCSTQISDGFPDLSSINRVSGEVLTKEQKDKAIEELQKEQQAHKEKAEN